MRLAIGLPSYGHHPGHNVASLMSLASTLTHQGIDWAAILVTQNPDFANTMNGIFARFLASERDRLLIVDDDVSFDATDAMRLVLSDRDYVGGNYPKKGKGLGLASMARPGGTRDGNLVEAATLATGMLAMSRSAVQRLADASRPYLDDSGLWSPGICATVVDGARWHAGDETMLRKWERLGEVAWIDTAVMCRHHGMYAYEESDA